MRGSTPLDVAAASVMDNNELALALREPDLEKVGGLPALCRVSPAGLRLAARGLMLCSSSRRQVVRYLAGCGLQSCPMLVAKGYPDIGWNPVEGERYLDFLRFAVFCNGRTDGSWGPLHSLLKLRRNSYLKHMPAFSWGR